jgi:hypothetical protein
MGLTISIPAGGGDVTASGAQTLSNKTFASGNNGLSNPGGTFRYVWVGGAIVADRNITMPVLTGNDAPVFEAHTQNVSNKTFASGNNGLSNPGGTFRYIWVGSAIAANRNVTMPLLTADDTVAVLSFAQTFANKTLDATCDVSAAIGAGTVDPTINGLRLTLTSGTPVTTSDVATATTVYLTPFLSGAISLYTGSVWAMRTTAEVSLALGTLTSGRNYDIFASWNGSAVVLEFSAAWNADNITRTDAIAFQNGVAVKSGSTTKRYVGTIRTISTTQTTDTVTQRFVWNGPEPWRQVPRNMVKTESTTSWTWATTNTWRQANAATANKVEYVTGNANSLVNASLCAVVQHTTLNGAALLGVGIDSTTVNSAQIYGGRCGSANTSGEAMSVYEGYPGLGYHALNWLERTDAATAQFQSGGGNSSVAGIRAVLLG